MHCEVGQMGIIKPVGICRAAKKVRLISIIIEHLFIIYSGKSPKVLQNRI